MVYDVASALFGKRTDGQGVQQAGGSVGAASVRHGTAQADSAGDWVTVALDGSEDSIDVYTESAVKSGQRLSVVMQGGIYKVVTLGDLPGRVDDLESGVSDVAQDLKDQMAQKEQEISDARKVAENFITKDSSGVVVSDVASSAKAKPNVCIDAYGVRCRRGTDTYAEFGEVTTLGAPSDYRLKISSSGQQFLDKSGAVMGTIVQGTDGQAFEIDGANGVFINGGSEHAGDEQHIRMGGGSVAMWTDYGGVNVSKIVDSAGTATGKIDVTGLDSATVKSKGVTVQATSGAVNVKASGAVTLTSTGDNVSVVRGGYTPVYINADGVRLRGSKVDLGDANVKGVLSYNGNWRTGFCVRKCGPVVIIDVSYTLAADISAGGYYEVGTVTSAYRPSSAAYARGALECTGGGEAFVYVNSGGVVRVYSSNGLKKGAGVNGQVVYFSV